LRRRRRRRAVLRAGARCACVFSVGAAPAHVRRDGTCCAQLANYGAPPRARGARTPRTHRAQREHTLAHTAARCCVGAWAGAPPHGSCPRTRLPRCLCGRRGVGKKGQPQHTAQQHAPRLACSVTELLQRRKAIARRRRRWRQPSAAFSCKLSVSWRLNSGGGRICMYVLQCAGSLTFRTVEAQTPEMCNIRRTHRPRFGKTRARRAAHCDIPRLSKTPRPTQPRLSLRATTHTARARTAPCRAASSVTAAHTGAARIDGCTAPPALHAAAITSVLLVFCAALQAGHLRTTAEVWRGAWCTPAAACASHTRAQARFTLSHTHSLGHTSTPRVLMHSADAVPRRAFCTRASRLFAAAAAARARLPQRDGGGAQTCRKCTASVATTTMAARTAAAASAPPPPLAAARRARAHVAGHGAECAARVRSGAVPGALNSHTRVDMHPPSCALAKTADGRRSFRRHATTPAPAAFVKVLVSTCSQELSRTIVRASSPPTQKRA
jgi:hypothetical protein